VLFLFVPERFLVDFQQPRRKGGTQTPFYPPFTHRHTILGSNFLLFFPFILSEPLSPSTALRPLFQIFSPFPFAGVHRPTRLLRRARFSVPVFRLEAAPFFFLGRRVPVFIFLHTVPSSLHCLNTWGPVALSFLDFNPV